MSPLKKRWMLGAGLLLTLAATGWVASQDGPRKSTGAERKPVVARSNVRHAPGAESEPMVELQLDQLRRPESPEKSGELFASQNWEPPAPQLAPAPPEPPRAPPLPFSYFGQMTEAGIVVVFLSRGGRDYAARGGEMLDGTYRIDEIRKDALVLTYLPLQQQQTLAIGPAK